MAFGFLERLLSQGEIEKARRSVLASRDRKVALSGTDLEEMRMLVMKTRRTFSLA